MSYPNLVLKNLCKRYVHIKNSVFPQRPAAVFDKTNLEKIVFSKIQLMFF